MLTKNDLSQIKTVIREAIQPEIRTLKKSMATKDDIKDVATKNDLKNLEVKLLEKMDESQMEIIAAVDKHKADKGKVDNLEKRVERLEDNAGLPPYADQ